MDNQVSGYDCEFVERPPSYVQSECPVCLQVLRDPYQVTCCGYAFCRACIENIEINHMLCPCCNATDFDKFEDKRLKRSLYDFKIKCCNKKQGCEWAGELGQLDNHLNENPSREKQLEGCIFSQIKCLFCSKLFLRTNIFFHQCDQCLRRPFTCEYCLEFKSFYEEVTTKHWPACKGYPVLCSNRCGKKVQRQHLKTHITHDCPHSIIDCYFKHVGCDTRLPRKDMASHLVESVVHHLSLQTENHKKVTMELAGLKEENRQLKLQVAKLSDDVGMHKACIPKQAQVCPVEFTMTNFEQRRTEGEVWCSPPFYTHLKGYKMRLCVYLRRHCAEGKNYVSIYVQLLKGEFDNYLKWPFRGSIEIELLNQFDGSRKEHDRGKVHFTEFEDISDDPGQRVTEGEHSKDVHGYKKFTSHDNLRPDYLKDDCLKFNIKAEI